MILGKFLYPIWLKKISSKVYILQCMEVLIVEIIKNGQLILQYMKASNNAYFSYISYGENHLLSKNPPKHPFQCLLRLSHCSTYLYLHFGLETLFSRHIQESQLNLYQVELKKTRVLSRKTTLTDKSLIGPTNASQHDPSLKILQPDLSNHLVFSVSKQVVVPRKNKKIIVGSHSIVKRNGSETLTDWVFRMRKQNCKWFLCKAPTKSTNRFYPVQ